MKKFPLYLRSVSALSISVLCLLTACGGDPETQASTTSMQTPPKLVAAAPADDTITFPEARKNYTIEQRRSSVYVTHKTTRATTSHLNAKRIQFSDMSVNLMVAQNSKTVSSKDLNSLIDLYIAFFNRVPDADGLNYWIDNFKAGATLEQIGANFYLVAKEHPEVTGYDAKMNDEAFVRLIYKNVLGRVGSTAPPDSHVAYWVGDLQKGLSKEKLVAVMLVAAREYAQDKEWGWMTTLLNNKVELGKYFALEQGLTYKTYEDSIRNTVALTAAVTSTTNSAAKISLGINDYEFNLLTSTGSGVGKMLDCFNPSIYAAGNTFKTEFLQTKTYFPTAWAPTYSYSTIKNDYVISGPVNFKNISALKFTNTNTYTYTYTDNNINKIFTDTSISTSYEFVGKDEIISYGEIRDETIPSTSQKTSVLTYNVPGFRTPFTLAPNEVFTQQFITYKENATTNLPISNTQDTDTIIFLGIEEITIPAGTFSACKIENAEEKYSSYSWVISSGPYRGLFVKNLSRETWTMEAVKISINGK